MTPIFNPSDFQEYECLRSTIVSAPNHQFNFLKKMLSNTLLSPRERSSAVILLLDRTSSQSGCFCSGWRPERLRPGLLELRLALQALHRRSQDGPRSARPQPPTACPLLQ